MHSADIGFLRDMAGHLRQLLRFYGRPTIILATESCQVGGMIMKKASKSPDALDEFLADLFIEMKDWCLQRRVHLDTSSLDLCALGIDHPTVDYPHLKVKAWDVKIWLHFMYDKAGSF